MVDNLINKQIGNYRVVAELAHGGFGKVYLGKHVVLAERTVAVKFLHSLYLGSSDERNRFLQEARLLEKLKHPYILAIYDVGIHEGIPYLITEYAQNGSLLDLLNRQHSSLLPPVKVLTILSQIGQALQHAHKHHIIHRDLKPANILFNANGDAMLADFGIASVLANVSFQHSTTIAGSPAYMAPEQFQGNFGKESDQYALGCIAYELFTGRKPFTVTDPVAWVFKHTMEPPIAPSQFNPYLPLHIEQAILKALAKERTNRHADIATFIAALHTSDNLPIQRRNESDVTTHKKTVSLYRSVSQQSVPKPQQKHSSTLYNSPTPIHVDNTDPFNIITTRMRVVAILSYLSLLAAFYVFAIIPIVIWFLGFCIGWKSRFARFHTIQAMLLAMPLFLLQIPFFTLFIYGNDHNIRNIIYFLFIIGVILYMLTSIIGLMITVVAILGNYLRLPFVGTLAYKVANQKPTFI